MSHLKNALQLKKQKAEVQRRSNAWQLCSKLVGEAARIFMGTTDQSKTHAVYGEVYTIDVRAAIQTLWPASAGTGAAGGQAAVAPEPLTLADLKMRAGMLNTVLTEIYEMTGLFAYLDANDGVIYMRDEPFPLSPGAVVSINIRESPNAAGVATPAARVKDYPPAQPALGRPDPSSPTNRLATTFVILDLDGVDSEQSQNNATKAGPPGLKRNPTTVDQGCTYRFGKPDNLP